MSDIWSGIGIEIAKSEGEWLFRQGGEIHGPAYSTARGSGRVIVPGQVYAV